MPGSGRQANRESIFPGYHWAATGGKIPALQICGHIPEPGLPLATTVQVSSHECRQRSKTRRRLGQTTPYLPTASFSRARLGFMLSGVSSKLELAYFKTEMSSRARYEHTVVHCKHQATLLPQEA